MFSLKKLLSLLTAATCTLSVCATVFPASAETTSDVLSNGNLSYVHVDEDEDGLYDYVRITECDPLAETVLIPKTLDDLAVREIDSQAFFFCENLTSVDVNSQNPYFFAEDGILFNEDATELICYPAAKSGTSYSIPETVTEISDCAFAYNMGIEEINIPSTVTSIGDYVFACCEALEDISIPANVESVGTDAFWDTAILNNQINNETGPLYYVDSWLVFADYESTSVTINEGTTGIADSAFSSHDLLANVEIPSGVMYIGDSAFESCTELSAVAIPESVKSIGASAFASCLSLTSVQLPDTVTSIDKYAFIYCNSLETVNIPTSLREISEGTFEGCSALTEIDVPANVQKIGTLAFYDCTSLSKVTINNAECIIDDSPCTFSNDGASFTGEIYAPENSTAQEYAYKYNILFESDESSSDVEIPYLLSLDDIEGEAGETVTMPVNVNCNNNFEQLVAVVEWEDTDLVSDYAYGLNGVACASDIGAGYCSVVAYGSAPIEDGAVAGIDFTIPEDAKAGTVYEIYFSSVDSFAEFSGDDMYDTVPVSGGTIVVTGGSSDDDVYNPEGESGIALSHETITTNDREVTLDLSLVNVLNSVGCVVYVYYPDEFICTGFKGDMASNITDGVAAATYVNPTGLSENFGTITFEVPEGTMEGTYNFEVSVDQLDNEGEVVEYPVAYSGSVTIVEAGSSDDETYPDPSLYLGNIEGGAGQTVTMPLSAKCANNLESFDVVLEWSDTALSSSSAVGANGATCASSSGEGFCTVVVYGTRALSDGTLAEIDFVIPEDAEVGTVYDIYISTVSSFTVWDGNDISDSLPVYGGTITVTEGSSDDDDSTGLKLSLGNIAGKAGQTVSMPVNVKCFNNFESMDVVVGWDDMDLTASAAYGTDCENLGGVASAYGDGYCTVVAYCDSSGPIPDGTVANIDFTIPEDAEEGTVYDVYFSSVNMFAEYGNIDDYTATVPVYNGTITVTEGSLGNDDDNYPDPSLYLADIEGKAGQTVSMPVNIKCGNNFESMDIVVGWNDTELTAEPAVEAGSWVVGSNTGSGYCAMIAYGSSALPDGTIATIDFTIPEDAEIGTQYDIYFSSVNTFAEFDGDDMYDTVPVYGGTITVTEGSSGNDDDDDSYPDPSLYLDSIEGKAGQTVVMPVNVKCFNNFESLDIVVNWDDEELIAGSVFGAGGSTVSSRADYGYCAMVAYGSGPISDGTVANIEFTIPEDAVEGAVYDICITSVNMFAEYGNPDDYTATVPVYNGTITVTEGSSDDDDSYPDPSLYLDNIDGGAGQTVTMPVNVKCFNNFESMDVVVEWSDTALIADEANFVGMYGSSSIFDNQCTVVAYDSAPVSDGTIATIDFTIPADAEIGTVYDVYFSSVNMFAEFGGDDLTDSVSVYGGTITVTEGSSDDDDSYPDPSLYLDNIEGGAGQTVTMPVNMKCFNNFESMDVVLAWDDMDLTAAPAYGTDCKNLGGVASDSGDGYCTVVAYCESSGPIPDGTIANIEFTIPEDAEIGTVYDIYFSSVNVFAEFGGDDLSDTVPVYGGTITVTDESTEELPDAFELSEGDSIDLSDILEKYTVISEDSTIAEIIDNVLYGVSAGITNIFFVDENDNVSSAVATVMPSSEIMLEVGESKYINVPGNYSELIWESTSEVVIIEDGLVTAVVDGDAEIYAIDSETGEIVYSGVVYCYSVTTDIPATSTTTTTMLGGLVTVSSDVTSSSDAETTDKGTEVNTTGKGTTTSTTASDVETTGKGTTTSTTASEVKTTGKGTTAGTTASESDITGESTTASGVQTTGTTAVPGSQTPEVTTTVTPSEDDILYGDANLDGEVNVRDCATIAKALAKGKEAVAKLPVNADYNRDGEITVRDAAALAKTLAKSYLDKV